MRAKQTKKLIQIILMISVFLFLNKTTAVAIPITGLGSVGIPVKSDSSTDYNDDYAAQPEQMTISQFVNTVSDGQSESIKGVYVTDVFALKVIQQPSNNAGYVSTDEDVATQFNMAKKYDTIGLLAHNNAAGQYFFDLTYGNIIEIVYGDGDIELYKVEEIYQYQALSPNSSSSNFTDLTTGATYSAADVFYQMYSGDSHLTLQTCIQNDSVDSWGRLFIIAYPL